MKNNLLLYKKYSHYFLYFFLIMNILFSRSFVGIYIFGFRIGEIIVAISLILSLFLLFQKKIIVNQFGKKIYLTYLFLILSTLILMIIKYQNIFQFYNFKSSSYIWLTSLLFLNVKFFKIQKNYLFSINIALLLIYMFTVFYFPNNLIKFFSIYSDKFDYLKPSDILLSFVITLFINNRFLNKFTNFYIEYFFILSALFFPIFIFKSRGSAVAALVFFLIEVFRFKEIKEFSKKRKTIVLFLSFLIFYISASLLTDIKIEEDENILQAEVISVLFEQKNTSLDDFLSFYIIQNIDDLKSFKILNNGRIFSSDGNINFRLQIWQDIILDSFSDYKFIIGTGFNEKIPAMNNPLYMGSDGQNEDVHNFLINIYARGGLIQFSIFLIFYSLLFKFTKLKILSYDMVIFSIPVFIVSFFDSSMSSPHFPFIFFLFFNNIFTNIKES